MRSKGTKTIAENRKARHEYFVLETYEAGIELVGTEVKSIRQGGVNLKDSWCSVDKGELFIRGMHISLELLSALILLSLIPLSLYFKDSRVKVQLGLCKGKKLYDKRADMAKRDAKREIDRNIKIRNQ